MQSFFKCIYCTKRFTSKRGIEGHVETVHEEKKQLMKNEENYCEKMDPLNIGVRDRNQWFYTVSESHSEFYDSPAFILKFRQACLCIHQSLPVTDQFGRMKKKILVTRDE